MPITVASLETEGAVGGAVGTVGGRSQQTTGFPPPEFWQNPFQLSFLDNGESQDNGPAYDSHGDSDDEFAADDKKLKPIGYEARMQRLRNGGPNARESGGEGQDHLRHHRVAVELGLGRPPPEHC